MVHDHRHRAMLGVKVDALEHRNLVAAGLEALDQARCGEGIGASRFI